MVKKVVWLILVVAALLAAGFGTGQDSEVYLPGNSRSVVRLHIIANSDSQFDQMVKLKVRDAIIAFMGPKLKNVENSKDAASVINQNRREMEEVARRVLLLSGVAYPVQVQFGQFDFPVKSYGDSVYPAGKYNAVRILLGEAEGSNWWCVLFPPLCFIDTTNAIAVKSMEIKQETKDSSTKKIELRWKLAEIWR